MHIICTFIFHTIRTLIWNGPPIIYPSLSPNPTPIKCHMTMSFTLIRCDSPLHLNELTILYIGHAHYVFSIPHLSSNRHNFMWAQYKVAHRANMNGVCGRSCPHLPPCCLLQLTPQSFLLPCYNSYVQEGELKLQFWVVGIEPFGY